MWVGVSYELIDGRFLGFRCWFYLVSYFLKNLVGFGDVGKVWSFEVLELLFFIYKVVVMVEFILVSGGCEIGFIKI